MKSKLRIRKLESSSEIDRFVGLTPEEWRISVYLWQSDWSNSRRRRWSRRVMSALESAMMSYHFRSGTAFPFAREGLSRDWLGDWAHEGSGSLVVLLARDELVWFFTTSRLESQSVVARSFHVKPLLRLLTSDSTSLLPSPERAALAAAFPELKKRGVATDHLPTAAKWIAAGAVTVVLASGQRNVWGAVDAMTGRLQVDAGARGRGCDDVLDDLLECAWLNGAKCWVVHDSELPTASPIVVYRIAQGQGLPVAS